MNEAAELLQAREHPAEVVAGWPCLGCGYDLRGQPTAGQCPECGMLILRSLRGPYLFQCDPGWLRRIRLGLWLVALCDVILALRYALFVLYYVAWSRTLATLTVTVFSVTAQQLLLVGSVAAIFVLTGTPTGFHAWHHTRAVHRLRNVALIYGLFDFNLMPSMLSRSISPFVATWAIALGIAAIGINFLAFGFLGSLASELPDRWLQRRLLAMPWLVSVTSVSNLLLWTARLFPALAPATARLYLPGFIVAMVVALISAMLIARLAYRIGQVLARLAPLT